MADVRLEGVTKRFGRVVALDNFTLDIKDGEFMVFVGPSGCGKTTALRIIAGLEEQTSGDVYIGGKLINDVASKDRDIAMVFQTYALYPHLSVYENLAFGLKIRLLKSWWWQLTHPAEAKSRRADIDNRVRKAAELLGISDLLSRRPRELSGGQRQRAALGRAIVREPKVFLMDEPLSNLDAKLRVQTRAELIRLHRRLGITTVYVTHDQIEAMTMGDRIAVMKDGLLQQVAVPAEIYENPANTFVASFIGSPPMNLFDVPVSDGHALLGAARIPAPNAERLTIGIRPEDFKTTGAGIEVQPTVDVIEPLGRTQLVMLNMDGQSFTASLDASVPIKEGQTLPLRIQPGAVHFFDAESGASIRYTAPDGVAVS